MDPVCPAVAVSEAGSPAASRALGVVGDCLPASPTSWPRWPRPALAASSPLPDLAPDDDPLPPPPQADSRSRTARVLNRTMPGGNCLRPSSRAWGAHSTAVNRALVVILITGDDAALGGGAASPMDRGSPVATPLRAFSRQQDGEVGEIGDLQACATSRTLGFTAPQSSWMHPPAASHNRGRRSRYIHARIPGRRTEAPFAPRSL